MSAHSLGLKTIFFILLLAFPAMAELVDRGDTVIDTEQCLTWTKDANLACTQGLEPSWQGCWFHDFEGAEDWVQTLVHGGHEDWRLSWKTPVSFESGTAESELEYLIYNILDNSPGSISNTGPFINVLQRTTYRYYNDENQLMEEQKEHAEYPIRMPGSAGHPTFNIKTREYRDIFMLDVSALSVWPVRDGCEIVLRQCEDGIDNDGDGRIDHPADGGCDNSTDNDETGGLIDNGETISDPDVCLMWAKNANVAGRHMNHAEAVEYAANSDYAGYDDWRLPSAKNFDGSGPCTSFDGSIDQCTESPFGHLYFIELGNDGTGMPIETAPFENLEPLPYWTSTSPYGGWAYEFDFLNGSQLLESAANDNRVQLVRDLVDASVGCPPTKPACSDGIDNDGDGMTDYPRDPGCCFGSDRSEGPYYLSGSFTQTVVQLSELSLVRFIKENPSEMLHTGSGVLTYLKCRGYLQATHIGSIEEDILPPPLCLSGPITTGAPAVRPPLECDLDQPGCRDGYAYRRVLLKPPAFQAFARWVEGRISDLQFDTEVKKLVGSGAIAIDAARPAKIRYLPRIRVTTWAAIGGVLVVLLLLAIGFGLGRRRR